MDAASHRFLIDYVPGACEAAGHFCVDQICADQMMVFDMLELTRTSDFLHYLLNQSFKPGDRLPPLAELSEETGISVSKLREQMEVVRMLGLVEASPKRGIIRTEYDFLPAVRMSLLAALELDRHYFDTFSNLRSHLELSYWEEAVTRLGDEDKIELHRLVAAAQEKLTLTRIQIPYREHRQLHLKIFCRLNNPFVLALLEAYWDGYEAVELNTYADYNYLTRVWEYHARIIDAICQGEIAKGKQLLAEHMQLLNERGVALESPIRLNGE